jgi:thioredoxin reductase
MLPSKFRDATLEHMETTWECVVVGGGAAGLSAALVLGRARRRTLVVDAGRQSNLVAHAINGLLGHDGRPAAEFYETARAELAKYPSVEVRTGDVVDGARRDDGFVLTLADGAELTSERVLLAPGMDYRPPDVPGVAERWGRSVFHCPFCHGWEVRERALGVLDDGAGGVHRALLLRVWSDDVTLFTDGPSRLDANERGQLDSAGVTIDERSVAALDGPGDELHSVRFGDGSEQRCNGLLVPVTLHQRSSLAERIGVRTAEPGPVSVDAIDVDAMYFTSVAGVSAAGDASSQMPSVASAIAAGSTAAAMIVAGLSQQLASAPGRTTDAAEAHA